MKLKTWLMISYLTIMLLPVVFLFLLYTSINKYDEQQDLTEYVSIYNQVEGVSDTLENGDLYTLSSKEHYREVKRLASDQVNISLYRYDGITLFSTKESPTSQKYFRVNVEQLYQNLNKFQKRHSSYLIKKPVFKEGEMVGIYEVTVQRKEWVEEVRNRTILFIACAIIFFIVLYTLVLYFLHHRLNKPLKRLQEEMTNFAKGINTEYQIKFRRDEIGILSSHFEKMKTQIEQSRKALEEEQKEKQFIVAALTHDLKTPLTVIQAYSEALERDDMVDENRQEYKHILTEKLKLMKQMLNDLSIYTSLQSPQNSLKLVSVEGQEFFDMVFSGYDEQCVNKNLNLTVQQHISGVYQVDVKQITRVIDNLMINAIRHTKQGQRVWLAAISSESSLPNWVFHPFKEKIELWRMKGTVILIQNEGSYIPKQEVKRVFEPFTQVDGARGLGGSSGLGLSISKILMEKHQGKIGLWSEENYGTLVACWIKEG
ncbi:HAMP domain-containing sensor histidine kinase [Bacillus weihaiensis]|uniref:HAMP domain-containing sensor histidine kinase n=1 Tax=Bacillus weihaiensis TaxID=1547283 RepID=UPI002357DF48|nr:HAMP domain-containing sensor histidine kinase [Bacillus weihaiensis]